MALKTKELICTTKNKECKYWINSKCMIGYFEDEVCK